MRGGYTLTFFVNEGWRCAVGNYEFCKEARADNPGEASVTAMLKWIGKLENDEIL